MTVRITHIGGPTALIEVGEWRLLTDPTEAPAAATPSAGAPAPES
jgi:L-ascorbate metabolism protein UlaG (beta-lactamase superfamily)